MCFNQLHLLLFLDAQFISPLANENAFLLVSVSFRHNLSTHLLCFLTQHSILGSFWIFLAADLGLAFPPRSFGPSSWEWKLDTTI